MSRRESYSFARWDTLVNGMIGSRLIPAHLRWRLLRLAGIDAAPSQISSGCFLGSRRITIGRGAFLNVGAFLDGSAPISIGEKAYLGPQVMILTSSHQVGASDRRAGPNEAKPVTVGAGSWLGARVTVLPGVSIGEGCVIASGAVVTTDCRADGLYAGVPAVRKSDLPSPEGASATAVVERV